jgi:hypothetical protein
MLEKYLLDFMDRLMAMKDAEYHLVAHAPTEEEKKQRISRMSLTVWPKKD